ncbi:MAG: putative metal-dependent hydrolase YcfH [Candidatus Anoxychlamydiales bacterium]|nr:putative metal-dependent hydrolase YcfH [Candidatus Anoxychlamydiales bacterium]
MKFFDSHAHLSFDEKSYLEADEVITRAKEKNVNKIINICSDLYALEKGLILKEKYKGIYLASAIPPHSEEKNLELFLESIEKALIEKQIIAIGETGLDYYYDFVDRTTQKKYFIKQLELAKKYDLPVIIHIRDAFDDFFEIVDEYYKNKKLLLHCFTGDKENAKKVLDRNFYISFSGIVTFKNAKNLKEVVKMVPLDKILIETDSPFLAPQNKRGKKNEPSYISETAKELAILKNINIEEVANFSYQNSLSLFNILCS